VHLGAVFCKVVNSGLKIRRPLPVVGVQVIFRAPLSHFKQMLDTIPSDAICPDLRFFGQVNWICKPADFWVQIPFQF
jgi:hypothetical protein